jgi:hypothetical protein
MIKQISKGEETNLLWRKIANNLCRHCFLYELYIMTFSQRAQNGKREEREKLYNRETQQTLLQKSDNLG